MDEVIGFHKDKRNTEREWMDDPATSPQDLAYAVRDINKVNGLLGGYAFTYRAVLKLLKQRPINSRTTIVDMGCSDGDILRWLAARLPEENLRFIGIDVAEKSIIAARDRTQDSRISYQVLDIHDATPAVLDCDILLCTLTLHHFDDREVVRLLRSFVRIAGTAVVINDLHRHIVAYRLFQGLSRLLSFAPISIHDGLVSIASGFTRSGLKIFLQKADITRYEISWKWSFRYLITIHTS